MPKKRPAYAPTAPGGSLAPLDLSEHTLADLEIEDERSLRHVSIYADLKEVIAQSGYTFLVLPPSLVGRWDRALLLNLTFWGATDGSGARVGGDILVDRTLPADVVAHVAWHHLAATALHSSGPPSADALFLGEAIASAFDLYLVGRLLGHAPASTFLETQVPAMAEAAEAAGLSEAGIDALLNDVARAPEASFESLRQLLFDATRALLRCRSATDGLRALASFDEHPFAPLLHRYELSNWVLHARAYVADPLAADPAVEALDQALRAAPDAVEHLRAAWVAPALPRG
ncbi:MAG TPA: hypothetical protein PK141_19330 [Polyangiaceae bacterium]|jgi:hypothetical protein|nr:hypothetical protein [Polyangiaceae bacterium]